VAIVRPPFRGAEQLSTLELQRDAILLVTRNGGELSRSPSVRLEQVAEQAFLQSPRVVDPIFAAFWYLRDLRRTPPVTSHATTVEEWLTEVSLGRGVSLIPASFADDYRRPGLAFVPVEGIADSPVVLAWKPASRNAPARRLLQLAAREATGPTP
jgi:DNA-binding transcriptional LysR family regulator